MKSKKEILLATEDSEAVEVVKSVLAKHPSFALVVVRQDLSQLRSALSTGDIAVVIVDIDPDPQQILRRVGTICHSSSALVIVIGSNVTKELVLQAMQAGARHFLIKANLASELSEVLQKLTQAEGPAGTDSDSQVISVFSASGGCGATTITINLANELRLLTNRKILAIDLDVHYGAVSTYLGIESPYGIADVLTPRSNVIDVDLITSCAYQFDEEFHLLTSPAGIRSLDSRVLSYENLPHTLEICREVYGYIVIDAPRLSQSALLKLAEVSDVILVVFQLMVKDVYTSRSIVSFLTESGIARERIIPVANRTKKRGPLVKLEDGERAIGLKDCGTIRSDWRRVMKSINKAKPLAEAARSSPLRGDFRKLALKVSKLGKNGRMKKS